MKTRLQVTASVFCILTAAILLTIYGAWLAYPAAIEPFQIRMWTGLERVQLVKNFNVLMTYLTNPFQRVLDMPDFPSSVSGLHHFAQVKWLFHLVQLVFVLTILPAISYLKNVVGKGFGTLYQCVFVWAALVPVLVAIVAALVGFDQFFILFHKILFAGDASWLFDPRTDPVINALPETFFLCCFVVFFVLYEILCVDLIALSKRKARSKW